MADEGDHVCFLGPMDVTLRASRRNAGAAAARATIEAIVEYAANVALDSMHDPRLGDCFPRWFLDRVPFSAVALVAYKLGIAAGGNAQD